MTCTKGFSTQSQTSKFETWLNLSFTPTNLVLEANKMSHPGKIKRKSYVWSKLPKPTRLALPTSVFSEHLFWFLGQKFVVPLYTFFYLNIYSFTTLVKLQSNTLFT
jgi:hypothetical protein